MKAKSIQTSGAILGSLAWILFLFAVTREKREPMVPFLAASLVCGVTSMYIWIRYRK